MSNDRRAAKGAIARLIALIVILIALFLAMKLLPVREWLRSFNDWVGQMGVAGIFIFIGVYAAATVLLAPGAILTIGAGFAFGLWKGFLTVSAGSTLGAALAFLVDRQTRRQTGFPPSPQPSDSIQSEQLFLRSYRREVLAVRARELARHDARHVSLCLYRNRWEDRDLSRVQWRSNQTQLAILDNDERWPRRDNCSDNLDHEDCARRAEDRGGSAIETERANWRDTLCRIPNSRTPTHSTGSGQALRTPSIAGFSGINRFAKASNKK